MRVNQTGILLYQNLFGAASNNIKVSRFITDQWDNSLGIWGDVNRTSWEINNNVFDPVKGLYGIFTANCVRFNMHDNFLDYPSSLNLSHHAVRVKACDIMNVQCNTVYNGPTNSGLNLHAFNVNLTPNSNFVCNRCTTGQRQMVFLENNINSMVKGNTFGGSALYGLCVGDDQILDAMIGEQPVPGNIDHGNKWSGSYNTYGAANFSTNGRIIQMSRFLVDQAENSQFLPTIPASQNNIFFLNQSKQDASFSCASLSSCSAFDGRNRTLGNGDTAYIDIINDDLDFEYYEDEQRWTSKYIIYKSLRQGNFLAEESSDFETFLEDNDSSELELLYLSESVVQHFIDYNQSLWNEIDTGIIDLDEYQLKLDTTVINWEEADSMTRDSLYEVMMNVFLEMDTIAITLDTIYEDLSTYLCIRVDTLISHLEDLSTSGTPAENLRLALILALRKVCDPMYEYDSTEIVELEDLSAICELEGGIGTNLAQAILGGEFQESFERYENCEFSSPLIFDKGGFGHIVIRISPIPANESIIIECSNISENDRNYNIVDIFGKKINALNFPAYALAISLKIEMLSPGVYYLVNSDDPRDIAKFIKD